MSEPAKVIRVDLSEEEAKFIVLVINYSQTMVTGDLLGQIEEAYNLREFIYSEDSERVDRLNAFRVRFAKLCVGEERVEQIIKDWESEVSAKGYKKCPDCGGYHA